MVFTSFTARSAVPQDNAVDDSPVIAPNSDSASDLPQNGQRHDTPSSFVRRLASFAIVLHLIAIASAPLAVAPASLAGQTVAGWFQPYTDAAYLNHGYHFFAPEPGPSHLIRYEVEFADGRQQGGVFPDSERHWPRLNYHRHFMLTEYANRLAVDPSRQESLDTLSRSFARHLLDAHHAQRVRLFLRRHYIPSPEQVSAGLPLDAAELYAERPLGTFDRETL